jgi:hypothetical protein
LILPFFPGSSKSLGVWGMDTTITQDANHNYNTRPPPYYDDNFPIEISN